MWRNGEGYTDPTASAALARIRAAEKRRERLRRELAGMTRKEFYHSMAWKRCRQAFISHRLAVDGGICQVCGDELGRIVHHKTWLTDANVTDPDVSLSFKNLRYECQSCHNKEVDPERETPGRCRYGPDGEIIPKAGVW